MLLTSVTRTVTVVSRDSPSRIACPNLELESSSVFVAWLVVVRASLRQYRVQVNPARPIDFVNAQIRQRSMRDAGRPETETRQLALVDLCQAIFAMNEFMYVD